MLLHVLRIKVLGIYFTYDKKLRDKVFTTLESVRKHLTQWKRRGLITIPHRNCLTNISSNDNMLLVIIQEINKECTTLFGMACTTLFGMAKTKSSVQQLLLK